jgi:hypothetical protein
LHGRDERGRIDSHGKIGTDAMQDGDAQAIVVLELIQGFADTDDDRGIDQVSRLWPIHSDQQHRAALLNRDPAGAGRRSWCCRGRLYLRLGLRLPAGNSGGQRDGTETGRHQVAAIDTGQRPVGAGGHGSPHQDKGMTSLGMIPRVTIPRHTRL